MPHLSTTIEQNNPKALPDFIWSCGSYGAPLRQVVRSPHAGAVIMEAAQEEAPLHMEINCGKGLGPSQHRLSHSP